MPTPSSPTVRRWELAARLKQLRLDAGLTASEVAEQLLTSSTKISRLETGDRPPQLRDVRDLCELYKVSAALQAQLMELARLARERGWWQSYDLNPDSTTYTGLEASALSIHNWEPLIIPGLLQTPAYTEAVVKTFAAAFALSDGVGVVNPYVQARVERQKRILAPGGPQVWAIVDEAALRRVVVSTEIMREQLQHLLEATEQTQAVLQFLPFDGGIHQGVQGPFVILEFEPAVVGDVVYSEGLAGQNFLERPQDLKRYRTAFDQLRAAAEGPERTRQFIRGLLAAA